ncbi:MAG: SpoIIE family protein phosphatase [Oscillospiraceae bacterium]|nr:SpoIIE family protein phosphatase [Oscillospiraceae bacterium]
MLTLTNVQERPQIMRCLTLTGCAVAACLLAAAQFNGMTLPLCSGLAAALPPFYAPAVLAGGLLAYFLSGTVTQNLWLIAALVITVLLRWMLGDRGKASLAALLAGAGNGIIAGIFALAGLLAGHPLLLPIQILGAAGFAYCVWIFRRRLEEGLPMRLCVGEAPAVSVCYVVALAALCAARIGLISIGEMLASLLLLAIAKRYGAMGGLLCGTLHACALLLIDTDYAGMAAVLPLAGLAAGYCNHRRSGTMYCLYSIICGLGAVLTVSTGNAALLWVNHLIGGLLFLFLPVEEYPDRILSFAQETPAIAAITGARMEFMSQSIAGVRGSAERIANMLSAKDTPTRAAERVCETVCGKCRSRSTCWESAYADTNACFRKMEQAGVTEVLSSPDGCLKPERVTEEFLRVKRQNAAARAMALRLRESQNMLFDQMRVTEELLHRTGDRMQQVYNSETTRTVTDALERFGVPLRAAAVWGADRRSMTIELYIPQSFAPDADAIAECLTDVLHRPLTVTGPDTAGDHHRLMLHTRPRYHVVTTAAQCAVHEDEPCGDGWDSFSDGDGNRYLVLSDGMGTGSHAAVDARIVLNNFRRLVQSGMDCVAAAQMVNAIMLTKSGEERFATLDIAKICGDTAAVTLYKYGAGPTFIRHGDRVTLCQAATVPIGILPKAEPYTTVLRLQDGDMLFLLSDGLDEDLYPFIRKQLAQGGDLQLLAHTICAKAQRDAMGAPKDDVTVAAAMIRCNNGEDS